VAVLKRVKDDLTRETKAINQSIQPSINVLILLAAGMLVLTGGQMAAFKNGYVSETSKQSSKIVHEGHPLVI
jgi:hypothetical protein